MSDRINRQVPIVERPDLAAKLVAAQPVLRDASTRVFLMAGCTIIVSHESSGWHVSIARRDRDPTWAEIATVRYRLFPEVAQMVMPLPPLEDYLNVHPRCYHLYETRESPILIP